MLKQKSLFLIALLIMSCFISKAWAISCHDFLEKFKKQPHLQTFSIQEVEERVQSIKTSEAFSAFLINISNIDSESNKKILTTVSRLIFSQNSVHEAQRISRNLLLTHRHKAKAAIILTFSNFIISGTTNPYLLSQYFPDPYPAQQFMRWMNLGLNFESQEVFLKMFSQALDDYLDFHPDYREYVDPGSAFENLISGFHHMQDPSLMGQFMEIFLLSDRLTRQYILDCIVELVDWFGTGDTYTIVLKGYSPEYWVQNNSHLNVMARSVDLFYDLRADQLQELAYFRYKTMGIYRKRPLLDDIEAAKEVAIRFIRRSNFDLNDHDVSYAAEVLRLYPNPDSRIKKILNQLDKKKKPDEIP